MCTSVPVCIACTAGCSCCRPVHFETGSCCRYVLQGPAYVHIYSVRTAVVISRYSALCTVVSLVCRGAALYCLRVKQRRQRHLFLLRPTFGHTQIRKKRKNGAVELVQSITYPTTPPAPKLIQCQHCPAKFENEQANAVHRKTLHPHVDAHEGTRLVNSMRDDRKVAMWPWEGFGMGRCWVARLGKGSKGRTVFQLQPKRLLLNNGFSCDDDKPVGRCSAGIRRVYTNREKAGAVEKLRRYQKQEDAIFTAHRMTSLRFTAKTVGTSESNISKWAKGEAQIIEKAAAVVTRDLMKNHRARAWFPKAERELPVQFGAKRKRGLKVSTLWLCVTMTGLIKKHYRDDPQAETFTPSWRYVEKWSKKFRVATRRRGNLKNLSIEERLPKIQRFHKSLRGLMQNPAPGPRGSNGAGAGGGQWDCTARGRRICGSGVGGARWRGACARQQKVRSASSGPKGQRGPGAYNSTYVSLCTVVYFICIQQFVVFSLCFRMPSVVCLNQQCYRRISHPMSPHSHLSVGAASVRQRLDHHVGRQREQARPHPSTVIWLKEAAVHSATVLRSWREGVQTRRDLPWYRKADHCS